MEILVRREQPQDERAVELLHRDAFWDLSEPGCTEHYLAHVLRTHADFVPELDCVATLRGRIVGSILYARSRLIGQDGSERTVLTFGPIGVAPDCQRRGIGKKLIETTFALAKDMGYGAVVIFGNPDNYVSRGFLSCLKYNVCVGEGVFPAALLVKELAQGFFDGARRRFVESSAYEPDMNQFAAFDAGFPKREKGYRPSQEEFFIHSRSVLRAD